MLQHSENTKRIISYLWYLRDISRKIISKNGFEKSLLIKDLGCGVQFSQFTTENKPNDENYKELEKRLNFLLTNHDKKLYLGFGTVAGTRKRIFAAPLLIIQCEISRDDTNQTIVIEPDNTTLSLNYDLISALSSNNSTEDEEFLNSFAFEENKQIEEIESLLKNITEFNINEINHLTNIIFNELSNSIESFKDIKKIDIGEYNFKYEYSKYLNKQIKNNKIAINNNKKDIIESNEVSIFEKDIVWVNANHYFISKIPDQLSTFEALNSFVQSINDENGFNNPVVEKLLVNALTEHRVEIHHDELDNNALQEIINNIPLSLSNSQIQGLTNAWTNEISYIQGPPGTGKSHTISAIICSAISMNKKVLVLSQKTAALNVVNHKIEPLISDEDGIIGICYYDANVRKKVKGYCNFLLNQTSNRVDFLLKLNGIKHELTKLEKELKEKFIELNNEKEILSNYLEYQKKYREINEVFLEKLDRINSDYYEIPKGFEFKKIINEKKYNEVFLRLEKIFHRHTKTLSTTLYVNKFKTHLLSKFKASKYWLNESKFLYFSKEFIDLNKTFTKLKNVESALNFDVNSIRKKLKNLSKDIDKIQRDLLKLKYKYNILSRIDDPNYRMHLEKFERMLYNSNNHIINKRMNDIDFNKITEIIPFWTAEIRNLGQLFPLKSDLFDLIIVDEASQVNLAEILPAFYRGKKICIVGDHNQLSLKASGLNFSLSKNFDELTWDKYNRDFMSYQIGSKKKLTVTQSSILDFIKSEDYQVNVREVMLDEHFRSLPHLALYTSKNFYSDTDNPNGKLKVMTETPDKIAINCFKAVRVNGKRKRDESGKTISKAVFAEAEEVVKIIESLISNKIQYTLPKHISKNNFSIGVISMIRDQCELVKELLSKKFQNDELNKFGIDIEKNEGVGTPEEFQGNERDIIIFSLCLDDECKSGQGHYQDVKRLNVATSRAKLFTYFVYSPFPKTFDRIYSYLNYINGKVNKEDLSPNNNELSALELPPLDYTKFESDFERYVYSYLDNFINQHSHSQKITLHNQVKSCGQKRLDFVVFNHNTKKSVAIEVDGIHHFQGKRIDANYTKEHTERIEILTRAGWNLINTPYHKWYKGGWLSEEIDQDFSLEIERIYNEIRKYIF